MKKRRGASHQNIESIISNGVEIKGELNSKGSIRIDGNLEGTMNVKGDLILGEKGFLKGEINAENMIVAGKIEGNVIANSRLEITSAGSITGDVTCNILIVEEEGILDGKSKMGKPGDKKDKGKLTEMKRSKA